MRLKFFIAFIFFSFTLAFPDVNENLFNSVYYGDIDKVKKALKSGADINALNKDGFSPLMHAIIFYLPDNTRAEIVKILVENGANANASYKDGLTALMQASYFGYIDTVKILIENGANVNTTDKNGNTALRYASLRYNNEKVIKLLLENGAIEKYDDFFEGTKKGDFEKVKNAIGTLKNINARYYGRTALMISARHGYTDIVNLLIENGAQINTGLQYNNFVSTALTDALNGNHIETAKLLIKKGADINVALKHFSVSDSKWSHVEFLIDYCKDLKKDEIGETLLLRSAYHGKVKMVKLLVERGVDINTMTFHSYSSPLMEAISGLAYDTYKKENQGVKKFEIPIKEYIKIVKYLIQNGANINARYSNRRNFTALHIAAQCNSIDIVNILIENGANINALDTDKHTALIIALDSKRAEIAKLLIKKGADINIKTSNRATVLHHAAESYSLEIVKFLIENGLDVNAKRNDGTTPLIIAARLCGNQEIIKTLIENGADVNAVSADGETALMFASFNGYTDITKLLIKKEANINVVSKAGYTALSFAECALNIERYTVDKSEIIVLLKNLGAKKGKELPEGD